MILDTAPNGILMVDEKGFIVLANKELENLFRYECNELLGEPIEILVPHAPKPVTLVRVNIFQSAGAQSNGSRARSERLA